MKKSTKKSLMSMAFAATATIVGLVAWTWADGEKKVKDAKSSMKKAA